MIDAFNHKFIDISGSQRCADTGVEENDAGKVTCNMDIEGLV